MLIRQYSTSSLYRRVLLPVLWRVVRRSLFGANLIALWAMLRIFLRRAVVWLPTKLHERRVGVEELLEDVPHRQEVFTIPKRLLNFHPHVHVLVTDGGFLPNGTFGPLAWFDSRHVERLFRAEVLRMLLEKELITEAIVDNLLSWRHSGFSAHGAVRVEDRAGAGRLGRYMIRCPVVLKRLTWEEDTGEVVYRGRPSRRAGPDGGHARWDVLEFLVRVVDHIPEPSQQMVRYWGFYANAARGKRRKAAAGDTPQAPRRQDDELSQRARLSWAKLIRRVYEVDPLVCPFCGAEMEILAFILDFGSAQAIRKSLKLPAQEPEPLAHPPPETLELLAESA